MSPEQITQLRAMAEKLCATIEPCPAQPTECDPRDVCTMCNDALDVSVPGPTPTAGPTPTPEPELRMLARETEEAMEYAGARKDYLEAARLQEELKAVNEQLQQAQERQAREKRRAELTALGASGPAAPLSACLSTINWACCKDSSAEIKSCYDFCPSVPELGWTPDTVGEDDLASLQKWWDAHCAATSELPFAVKAALTEQMPALGAQAAMETFKLLESAQSKRIGSSRRSQIRLLGMPSPKRDHRTELAASMRRLAASRPPCEAELRASALRAIDEVLCEQGRRC